MGVDGSIFAGLFVGLVLIGAMVGGAVVGVVWIVLHFTSGFYETAFWLVLSLVVAGSIAGVCLRRLGL